MVDDDGKIHASFEVGLARTVQIDGEHRGMKKDLDGVDLAVLQVNVQLARGGQAILRPAHCARFA